MELKLTWQKPLRLTESKTGNVIYELDLDQVPQTPGVYIFMRVHGNSQTPLYIGKATRLKGRIKQQLDTLRLMKGIQNGANGSRFLLLGEFNSRSAQKVEKCLPLIEKALIRHFLSEGHELLNKAGTRLAKHSLTSEQAPRHFVPHRILFE